MSALNPEIFVAVMAVIFLIMIAFEVIASWWLKKGFYTKEYLIINLSLSSLQQIFGLINQALFLSAFVFVQTHFSIQTLLNAPEIASGWPLWVSGVFPYIQFNIPVMMNWILVLILADFCQYWLHRLSHEVNILWAGHIVHHSNTEYNYGVAIRQSFLEGFYTWIFYLPLAFIGIPWELYISAYTLSLLWQFFVHTRFVDRMGVLEKFMATPSHHRAHHGKNDIYLDKNYGALFIIWDKIFGTFQEETESVDYGITVPLTSNHLLWINMHQHVHIFKLWKKATGIRAKFSIIFSLPSYVPKGTELKKSEVVKFQFSKQTGKQWYVFLTFLLTSIAGLIWMNEYRINPKAIHYILMASVLTINLLTLSALLEDKHWANVLEVTKLCILLALGSYFVLQTAMILLGMLMIAFAIICLFATYFLAAEYKKYSLIYSN